MNNENVQNVEIYLDYATIPSLNYFLHFAENYQDTTSIRIFGLSRFTIPESIISAYPEGIIRFFPVSVKDPDFFNDVLSELFNVESIKYNLYFHLNLYHSFYTVLFILELRSKFRDKIKDIHINFYDDGAEGIVCLNDLSKNINLEQKIMSYQSQIKNSSNIEIENVGIFRYLWGDLFSCNYYLLRADYLNKKELLPLKVAIQNRYQEMNLSRYTSLSEEQKRIILDILNITPENQGKFREISEKQRIFLFTGTTIFNYDEKRLADIHSAVLGLFTNKQSKCYIGDEYKLYYKGHPHSKFTNQFIKSKFPECVCLEDNIPFEIMLFLGFKPEKMGGFASTSYLFLTKKEIANIMFLTDDKEKDDYLSHNQYVLSQILKELDYISSEQIFYCQNIYS